MLTEEDQIKRQYVGNIGNDESSFVTLDPLTLDIMLYYSEFK